MVDDEQVIREILADFLSLEGFEVRTAADGAEAPCPEPTCCPRLHSNKVEITSCAAAADAGIGGFGSIKVRRKIKKTKKRNKKATKKGNKKGKKAKKRRSSGKEVVRSIGKGLSKIGLSKKKLFSGCGGPS